MYRVLVVDDERLVADTISLVFGKSGFETRAAYSADEALTSARDFQPNLLLCDVSMPGKDGLHLMKEISRELPDCRILLLTGFYSNLATMQKHVARLSRPVSILTKPCQPDLLLREATMLLAS
jgi:CheY-like chemotaxis protein